MVDIRSAFDNQRLSFNSPHSVPVWGAAWHHHQSQQDCRSQQDGDWSLWK